MRILLSTTLGHNPGDEIIAEGVKHLLRFTYPEAEYVLYNRNPDLQGPGREALCSTLGNYQAGNVDLSYIDMVVLAGSPEWFGNPMKALYEALDKTPKPLLAIGVGLGDKSAKLSDLDQRVLSKAQLITTRSTETTEFLKRYNIWSEALVCPAFFSGVAVKYPITNNQVLQIIQKPGHGWHEVRGNVLEGLTGDDLGFVHIKELQHFNEYPNRKFYANDPKSFAHLVQQYDKVFSTRLHGAIGALAQGVPSVVVTRGDFRIETAAKMFSTYLPIAKNFAEAYKSELPSPKEILELQDFERGRYLEVLRS